MKAYKGGLAELKRLRAEAATHTDPAAPPARTRADARATPAHPRPRDTADAAHAPDQGPAADALGPADRALFRQAVRFVRPLRDPMARAPGPSRLAPEDWLCARRAHAAGTPDAAPAMVVLPATRQTLVAQYDPDACQFLRSGCGTDLLRGLRRGKWPIEATLDLHGSTLEQVAERMDRFLASCLDHGVRCVRIVHGKGYGSRTGVAILKDAVRKRLTQLEAVQAWAQCGEPEGGAGAVMALLRLPSPTKDVT
ncbi:Smr/MutS family protein [Castellaniella sp. GW247-6E4]|uniref:Smr/MutS family protein n=1 Tax=Castellaniella sp. GW247-6E4 TaxID=3140380 RepID=UPI0033152D92